MPAVSQREYLRHATGADTAQAHDAQLAAHAEPGTAPPPPPAARAGRPFAAHRFGTHRHVMTAHVRLPERPDRSQEGRSERQPSAGHERGVPGFPAPLPGAHAYPLPAPAAGHTGLDVGPAKPYYSGGMAHGVPAPPSHGGRPAPAAAEQLAARGRQAAIEQEGPPLQPVPVYMVSRGAGARPLRKTAMGHKNVPAPGGDPFVLIPRDPHRRRARLLNESANAVRLTFDPLQQPAAAPGYGALLPASMTSYLTVETQDEVWAYTEPGSTGGAQVSWISEYDVPNGG